MGSNGLRETELAELLSHLFIESSFILMGEMSIELLDTYGGEMVLEEKAKTLFNSLIGIYF